MREILFRGKRKSNGKWIEGYVFKQFVNYEEEYYIRRYDTDYLVDPKTIGQFTGLTDKNGKKIFEGDIMSGKFANYVFWYDEHEKGFCYGKSYKDQCRHSCSSYAMSISESDINIIGNVHDNPELLKGE